MSFRSSEASRQNKGLSAVTDTVITRVFDMTRQIWLQPCKSIQEAAFVYGVSATSITSILRNFRKPTDNPRARKFLMSPVTKTKLTFRPANAEAVEIIKERRDN